MVSDGLLPLSFAALLLTSIFGLYYVRKFALDAGTMANLRSLMMINFLLIHPISGISHFSSAGTHRGYFDLLTFSDEYIIRAVICTIIAFAALAVGSSGRMPRVTEDARSHFSSFETNIVIALLLLLGPLSLLGLFRVYEIAEAIGTSRIISLDGGTARYAFLSHWFGLLITLCAMALVGRVKSASPLVVFLLVGVSLVLIALSVAWSGGRSIVVVMGLPLVLYAWPRLRRLHGITAAVGVATLLCYVVLVSEERSNSLRVGAGVNLANWLDWEWGRFSLVGTSFEYVRYNGYLSGETLLAGVATFLAPVLDLLEISSPNWLTSMDIPSRVLFGDFSRFYVVPGFNAELYVNFGFLGVATGFFILGRLVLWIDVVLKTPIGPIERIFFLYIGVLLTFRVLPSDSASILVYLIYSGFPLILAAGLFYMRRLLGLAGRRSIGGPGASRSS